MSQNRNNYGSPKGYSDVGDVRLPNRPPKHSYLPNGGELSRVGHYPDEAGLTAISRMKPRPRKNHHDN